MTFRLIIFFISLSQLALSQVLALQPLFEYQKYYYNNQESPYAIEFHPKLEHIAISTNDNRIKVINYKRDSIWEYKAPMYKGAPHMAYTPDGTEFIFKKYLSGSDIAIFDASNYQLKQNIKVDKESVYNMVVSKDGKSFYTVGSESIIKIFTKQNEEWDVFNELIIPVHQFTNKKSKTSVSFDISEGTSTSNSSRRINIHFAFQNKLFTSEAVSKRNDTVLSVIRIFETSIKKNKSVFELEVDGDIKCIGLHPNEKDIVVCTNKELIVFEWRNNTLVRLRSFIDFSDADNVSFDKMGKYIMMSIYNSIKICKWDNQNLKVVNDIDLARSSVYTSFSPDNKYFACNVFSYGTIVWKTGLVQAASKDNRKNSQPKTGTSTVKEATTTEVSKTYFFGIGIDDYKDYPKLFNAKRDAADVQKLLVQKYNIEASDAKLLLDNEANSKNIFDALNEYVEKLGENDQLLIYYSGHGHYNKQLDEGYWIPCDATLGKELDFLPNTTLIKYLKAIPAKHIFLVVDACFSGSLMSSGTRGYIENVTKYKSRWALTSGRYEAVSDGIEGKNSPFAQYFMKYLTDNTDKKFAVSQLVNYVKQAVSNNAEQTPWGNAIRHAGDEGGEFVFELK